MPSISRGAVEGQLGRGFRPDTAKTWLHAILADASLPQSKYLASAELAG